MSLTGQVGLVTGAARGIGEAVAQRLGADGAHVVCLDVNDASPTAQAILDAGGAAQAQALDVTSASGWSEAVASVTGELGRIHFLVNVAGINVLDPDVADTVVTVTEEWWDRIMATNLKSVWLGMRAVIGVMQTAGGGRIVNTSSLSASRGVPGFAAYASSKGGIEALTRQAAAEYADDDILINAVSPGAIRTPLMGAQPEELQRGAAAGHLVKRLGESPEIASAVSYLLGEGSFVTGAVLPVDGGWSARG
jgi:NAD(P)-dependent dehydrogenase (short-subunit alcohol dehydrogenase family)